MSHNSCIGLPPDLDSPGSCVDAAGGETIFKLATVFVLHLHFWMDKGFLIPGGYFGNFWVEVCRWDPGTLGLYQS